MLLTMQHILYGGKTKKMFDIYVYKKSSPDIPLRLVYSNSDLRRVKKFLTELDFTFNVVIKEDNVVLPGDRWALDTRGDYF